MKITSGKYKYRNIEIPRGIRPTTEKVREAVFSMIMQWLPDAAVLDLFAGSGAMGLEALSRGASRCIFVEMNRQNQKVLTSNIANCGAGKEAEVYGRDFEAALTEISGRKEKPVFDIVILDPPYEKTEYYETAMMKLQELGLVDDGSVVVCEHLYDNKLLDTYGNLSKFKEKKYGTIGVDLFFVDNREPFC
jgi:16S rRNA (guanine(966)-N(2))-methyltransferase RsmD